MERSYLVDILRNKKNKKILIVDGEIKYWNLTLCYYGEFQNQGCALIWHSAFFLILTLLYVLNQASLDSRKRVGYFMNINNVNLSSKEMTELIDERAQIKIEKIMKQFDNNIKTNGQYDEVTKIIKKQTAGECKLSIYSNKQQ